MILSLWLIKLTLVKFRKTKNIFSKIVIFLYRTLFSIAIFDIEFFAVTEVAFVDITRVEDNVIRFSYITSLMILMMLTYEFCNIISVMNNLSKLKISRKIKAFDKLSLNYDEILFLEEMTGGLNFRFAVQGNPIIAESYLHLLIIQIIIVTLQNIPNMQVILIVMIEILYMMRLFQNMIIPNKRTVMHRKTGVMRSIANLENAKTYMTLKSIN